MTLERMYAEQKAKCTYCKMEIPFEHATVEHVIPVSKGGSKSRKNLRMACRRCNEDKGDKTPEEWHEMRRRRAEFALSLKKKLDEEREDSPTGDGSASDVRSSP